MDLRSYIRNYFNFPILFCLGLLVSCTQSRIQNPSYAFFKAEFSSLVEVCTVYLQGQASVTATLTELSYAANKQRTTSNQQVYTKREQGQLFPAVANVRITQGRLCAIDMTISGVSRIGFNDLQNLLNALGYRVVRSEKTGTFKTVNSVIYSNGSQEVRVIARSQTSNGIGNLLVSILRV